MLQAFSSIRSRFQSAYKLTNSLCTDIAHEEKKIAGLPQTWILTLSLRNLTRRISACKPTREYASASRELVSMNNQRTTSPL